MEKRQLPTRHNFLTEAVQNLLDSRVKVNLNHEPALDSQTILTITSDLELLKEYTYHDIPTDNNENQNTIVLNDNARTVPKVKIIKPVQPIHQNKENTISEEYYLKKHRKYEMEEKKQKNREKEQLRHGYYQQKQLVERIKTMDRSVLQSIVSSIRHRTHQEEQDDLEKLHEQLLKESMDLLRRYEALGFYSPSDNPGTVPSLFDITKVLEEQEQVQIENDETEFQKALKQQKELEEKALKQPLQTTKPNIKSFSNDPVIQEKTRSVRRSTRHVIAFGQRLPPFETEEFILPPSILEYKKP